MSAQVYVYVILHAGGHKHGALRIMGGYSSRESKILMSALHSGKKSWVAAEQVRPERQLYSSSGKHRNVADAMRMQCDTDLASVNLGDDGHRE